MAAFLDELLAAVESASAERLIVDLRNNSGGNSAILGQHIERIGTHPRLNAPGRLVGLIGSVTYSSGMRNAFQLRADGGATLIGEPHGRKAQRLRGDAFLQAPELRPAGVLLDQVLPQPGGDDLDRRSGRAHRAVGGGLLSGARPRARAGSGVAPGVPCPTGVDPASVRNRERRQGLWGKSS